MTEEITVSENEVGENLEEYVELVETGVNVIIVRSNGSAMMMKKHASIQVDYGN